MQQWEEIFEERIVSTEQRTWRQHFQRMSIPKRRLYAERKTTWSNYITDEDLEHPVVWFFLFAWDHGTVLDAMPDCREIRRIYARHQKSLEDGGLKLCACGWRGYDPNDLL